MPSQLPTEDSYSHTVVINTGSIITHGIDHQHDDPSGYSPGIDASSKAFNPGSGATAVTSVTNAGSILTLNYASDGIDASSWAMSGVTSSAATNVVNAGKIITRGNGSDGVYATATAFGGTQSASVKVFNTNLIKTYGAYSEAIDARVVGLLTGTINVTNAGSLIALGSPYTVIKAMGAATTIDNGWTNPANSTFYSGYIRGNLQLSNFNDTFNNLGTATNPSVWVMQGNSDFGRGNDTVNNSGVVRMLNSYGSSSSSSGSIDISVSNSTNTTITVNSTTVFPSFADGAPAGAGYYVNGPVLMSHHNNNQFHTIFIDNLETWNNSGGLITMVNGYNNQQIVMGPSTNFNGTGNSRLAVDAFLGAPGSRADILTIGGNVTGTTHIVGERHQSGARRLQPGRYPGRCRRREYGCDQLRSAARPDRQGAVRLQPLSEGRTRMSGSWRARQARRLMSCRG